MRVQYRVISTGEFRQARIQAKLNQEGLFEGWLKFVMDYMTTTYCIKWYILP